MSNNNNTNTTNATSDSICVLIDKYLKLKDNESNTSTTSTNTTVNNLSNISQLTGKQIFTYLTTNKPQVIEDIKFLNELIEGHIDQSKKKPKFNSENHNLKEIGEQLSLSFTNEKKLIKIFFNETSKISFMARFCDKESTLTKEKQHKNINEKFKDMIEIIKKFEKYSNNYINCNFINATVEFCSSVLKGQPGIVKVRDDNIKTLIQKLNDLKKLNKLPNESFEKFENFENLIIKVIDS
jgi:hypothetical protein